MNLKMNLGTLASILLAYTFASSTARDANLEKLATANNIFALNLHKALSEDNDENVFFSPLSVATVLSMLYYGTRGESAEELRQTLGYNEANLPEETIHHSFHELLKLMSNSTSRDLSLKSANTILVDTHLHLLPEYKKNVQDLYMVPVRSVDFRTNSQRIKEGVNAWAEAKTGGMIKELLKDVDYRIEMILLNAVYFKGKWENPFEISRTTKENFYNERDGRPRKVDMMVQSSSIFPYYTDWDYKAIELPYEGERLSMLILLPSSNKGLSSLEQSITASKLQDIRRKMQPRTITYLMLPKFKLGFEVDFKYVLQYIGLYGIFEDGSDDFSGMVAARDSSRMFVSDVIHKCEVEVNEEGTKAAAATAVRATSRTAMWHLEFRADHPFLFFIIDKVTGLILFMGRVSEL